MTTKIPEFSVGDTAEIEYLFKGRVFDDTLKRVVDKSISMGFSARVLAVRKTSGVVDYVSFEGVAEVLVKKNGTWFVHGDYVIQKCKKV